MVTNKYYTIFQNAPQLITMIYSSGIMKSCNNRINDILGYEKKEVVGKCIDKLFDKDFLEKVHKNLNLLMSGTSLINDEYKMKKKNGELIDVSIKSTMIKDEKGEKHTICFISDITKQKKSERQFIEIAHDLKNRNEELEQFAYIASHDLQEPLRVISSYCQLLREKKYDFMEEEGKKYLDYVVDASFRMKTLIKELLDYSRVGKGERPFEEINLDNLLEEVLSDFKVAIKETNAIIIIESDMPIIFGIKFRIKQLLHNLISNSLKFRGDKLPIIRIGCCDEEDSLYWLFYIKDNGIGIETEYYDKIFGLFKRLYSREEYPGTGIGLAICERIVETHEGQIWVDSDIKEGTWIYFTVSKNKIFPFQSDSIVI